MAARTNKAKIEEALQLLEDTAKEEKDIITTMVGEKYDHLQEALGGTGAHIKRQLYEGKRRLSDLESRGEERVREAAVRADTYVHQDPWRVMGAVAMVAMLAGFLIGRDRK
jgi:ElaB protein